MADSVVPNCMDTRHADVDSASLSSHHRSKWRDAEWGYDDGDEIESESSDGEDGHMSDDDDDSDSDDDGDGDEAGRSAASSSGDDAESLLKDV